ncbi:MAG: hypothetical protein OEZ13_11780 [Spirochaetia bacterium]|nr:hypothetical protein [Spirochaetia bacterium]
MKRKIGSLIILLHITTMTGYVSALEKNIKVCKCDAHEAGHEHEDCDCGMCDMKHGKGAEKKNESIISKLFIKNPPCHEKESNYTALIFGADLFISAHEKHVKLDNKEYVSKKKFFQYESVVLDRFDKPS